MFQAMQYFAIEHYQKALVSYGYNRISGFENFDLFQVDTREEFYEDYGYYPEQLFDNSMIWEGQFTYSESDVQKARRTNVSDQ